MNERPIMFSGEMVRAILDGRKTQTRRVVKRHGSTVDGYSGCGANYWASLDFDHAEARSQSTLMVAIIGKANAPTDIHLRVPRSEDGTHHRVRSLIKIGDRLWVREQWKYADWTEDGEPYIEYAADGTKRLCRATEDWVDRVNDIWAELSTPNRNGPAADTHWRSPIFMPRWASRLALEVTGVRVERLQDISEGDCAAEGIQTHSNGNAIGGLRWEYAALWERINGEGSWDENPWVWVIEFKRMGGST